MPKTYNPIPMYGYGAMQPAGGSGGKRILGATFDGTNDYLTNPAGDWVGLDDSKVGTFACRVRYNGGDGVTQQLIINSGTYFNIYKATTNGIIVKAKNSAGASILSVASNDTITADGAYHQVLISWDLATGIIQFYIDDSDSSPAYTPTNDIIDYTRAGWGIGAISNGSQPTNADITFMYVNFDEAVDLSVEANRRKLFNSNGDPALSPTGDGSISGVADPLVYLSGQYDTWHINNSSGGGCTVTGALTRPSL